MDQWLNKIICGNAIKVMQDMPDKYIDLIVTSPPYDELRDYKGYVFDFENMAKQIYRILKNGSICVWIVGDATINGNETGTSFKQALYFKEIGFKLHDTMIYEKNTPAYPSNNRYGQVAEYVFILSNGKPKTINLIKDKKNIYSGEKNRGASSNRNKKGELVHRKKRVIGEYGIRDNIWRYSTGYGYSTEDEIAFKHPAIFPEQLALDHIISWSNEGDIILDPMCGSGTTCKMAFKAHRNYIGIDISKEYCDISKQRLAEYESQLNLFK